MQPMSDDLQAALRGSHAVTTSIDVIGASGAVLASLVDTVDGSVTVERADIERRADLQLLDVEGDLSPVQATSLIAPYGNSLRIHRGVRFADGTTELVPLITGRIARASGNYPNLQVTVYDYAWVIQRARLESAYTIAAGTNYVTAISALLGDRFPGVLTNFPTTTATTPLIVLEEQTDPWEQARKMAGTLGKRLFFNGLGICTMVDETTSSSTAVWDYQEGVDSLIVALDRDLDTEQNYNAVVVTGETTENDQPVRAVAYDLDPLSPTQWGGAYGKAPRFYASEFITTVEQAQATADSMLLNELGMTEQLQIIGLVNPAHEIGDVVAVRRAASGVDENHILDNITIPLKGATANLQTRARQVLAA